MLHHVILGMWASVNFGICLGSWNQPPQIPRDDYILGKCGSWLFECDILFKLVLASIVISISILLILKLKKWAWLHLESFSRSSSGTVFDDTFWLELNYLEVAKVAQSCAAHFTALLYAEIYADKKNMEDQEKR